MSWDSEELVSSGDKFCTLSPVDRYEPLPSGRAIHRKWVTGCGKFITNIAGPMCPYCDRPRKTKDLMEAGYEE